MGSSFKPAGKTTRLPLLRLEVNPLGWQFEAGSVTIWVAFFRLGVRLFGSQFSRLDLRLLGGVLGFQRRTCVFLTESFFHGNL